MTTRGGPRFRALRAYLVLAVALCAIWATLGVPTSAASRLMAAVASPATGLGDQVIKVSWSGFHPTQDDGAYGVVVLECRAHPASVQNDCNNAETFPYDLNGNQQAGKTSKQGTGSVFIDIMTTARLPSLACSQSTPCSLLVYEITADGYDVNRLPPAKTRVIVPITFARNAADCPPVVQYNFSIEAEASAAPALYQWAAALCTGKRAFTMDITNTSSNGAREDFFGKQVDMGVSTLPPQADDGSGPIPKYAVAPLDLTAVVIAYNIVDSKTDKQITDLVLTPRLVARLLSDTDIQSFFRDPEFRKLNPHHSWPLSAADPGLRGEKNADTWMVSKWVNANKGARAFLDGKDRYGVKVNPSWIHVRYPTDVYAARNSNGVYFPRIGQEGVARRLFAGTKPADSVPTDALNAGLVGILDLPTALRFKLPIAQLTNGVGKPVVAVTGAGLTAGYNAMRTTTNGFHFMPGVVKNPLAYPLTKVDHAMLPTKLTGTNKDLRIRAFLDYAVNFGQATLPPGYVPLPSALQLQTLRYTGDLPDPTPPTTPTTVPYNPGSGASDYSGGSSDYVTPTTPITPSPPTAPTTAPRSTATTRPAAPATVRFVALRLPDSGDAALFPIIAGLGGVAILAAAVDLFRRRALGWLRTARSPRSTP